MTAAGSRALLYVTHDLAGAPRVVAALERGADGGSWLLPDPGRISSVDPRGRRTTLGALLGAHAAGSAEDLVDLAAHLVPLPELDPEGAAAAAGRPPRLDLRWVGVDGAELPQDWPAPGGGAFQVHAAPLRLTRGRSGALLASRDAPGGPWLRALEPVVTEVRALLELLAEFGLPLDRSSSWIERWLERVERDHGSFAPHRAALREAARELVRAALLEGPRPAVECGPYRLAVRADAAPEHIRWRFELAGEGLELAAELETARFAPDAVADLLAVVDAPQQPYWLLLFEPRPDLGQVFVGVVDFRRYLSEHLDTLEGGGEVGS